MNEAIVIFYKKKAKEHKEKRHKASQDGDFKKFEYHDKEYLNYMSKIK